MSYLGTFSPYVTVPVDAVVKIEKDIPLDKAALIGCGVPTGWGSSVYAADMQLGDTVVIVGIGGVGINAVQGAVHKGARNIVAVDPVSFKQEQAQEFGATHAVGVLRGGGDARRAAHERAGRRPGDHHRRRRDRRRAAARRRR